MYLDSSYFQGELFIPNLKLNNSSYGKSAMLEAVGESNMAWMIEKYENEALGLILGPGLRDEMIEGLKNDEDKWQTLFNKIYVKGSHGNYSPVANYVYFMIMKNGRTQTSPTGEVRKRTDNTSVVNDRSKLIKAWNDMCIMINDIHMFISNSGDYGELGNSLVSCFKPINEFGI